MFVGRYGTTKVVPFHNRLKSSGAGLPHLAKIVAFHD